ncbi:hypothetical protein GCM10011609_50450 [Lentzea pudingi]|uniref:DUF3558 domain-containing protein n=1 Tax=Lentzea pudingi TaxID=1789439 RepID=A0ABQ2IA89_9PSEU|nr:DUF3558 domain-containing protein [Lentzea pudingi]GGN05146.1 hypothetical protein GCM10011609_50450 [Lentzea pudingi]
MSRLAVPFLLAAVLAGCSSTEPGKPSAEGAKTSAPTTGTSAGTAPVNRPKNVDMLKLDPCSLITPEVKATLGMRLAQPGDPDADFGEGSKNCTSIYEDRAYTTGVDTLVNGGVDRLMKTVGEANVTKLQVAGYPAYLNKRDPQKTILGCDIYIDANDGQMLFVSAFTFGDPKATVDGACERATKLANAVGPVLATK